MDYIIKVLVIGQRATVVAAQKSHNLALFFPIGDALAQPIIFLFRGSFDTGVKFFVFLWFFVDCAFIQGIDDVLAQRSHLIVQFAEFLGKFVHPDAFLPKVGVVVVAKVDLQ